MVVEFLTFDVEPEVRDQWLKADRDVWTRYLEGRPGFVSKQVWVEQGNPGQVHAVITWTEEALWKTVPLEDIERIDAAMGDLLRPCVMRVFDDLDGF